MIVYRSHQQDTSPDACFSRMRGILGVLETGSADHDRAVELLVEFGELEAGVADAVCPKEDSDGLIVRAFRQAGLLAARVLCLSWEGRMAEAGEHIEKLKRGLDALASLGLPETIRVSVPEGYAFSSLYPEMYLEAASRFFRAVRPKSVVCIGIRSIGTSLSSAVCARLEQFGCDTHSYTVRPHGHPFDRYIALSPMLENELRGLGGSHFLVIDEGPGLSGSSLCCVARKLSEIGIPDERIVFFPSWEPDGSAFKSESARERWGRHARYSTSFEDVWLDESRSDRLFPPGELTDVSAGRWRTILFEGPGPRPAVHPHHERRKYLCADPSGKGRVLFKFAGLGRYGRAAFERSGRLAEKGFSPPVLGLSNGFLRMAFVEGRPVFAVEADRALLDAMADYLSYLEKNFSSEKQGASDDELARMIRANVREGLGEYWERKLENLEEFMAPLAYGRPVAMDGRMLPHEWLRTPSGRYVKTDGADHHCDHFYPGCQDIAWDIAGCCVEFSLDRKRQDYFVERFAALSKDGALSERIVFHTLAYLA
ncbi:MAG: hypothetical protein ACLGPL_03305, partial [Acidobacteriota bacterium]